MKIPNFGYHFARLRGDLTRRCYRALLPIISRRNANPPRNVSFEVFAYSGQAALPEQVASIRSFLRNVGRPQNFNVISDGSYSGESIQLLRSLDPSVTVREASSPTSALPGKLQKYLTMHSTGKQLALIMSLPRNGPALYVDSDVLFFGQANDLIARAERGDVPAYYLADCQFSGDTRLLRNSSEQAKPVNTGVLMLFRKLDWSGSIDRFLNLDGEPIFFTNQTMTHLTMHENGAQPFDPAKYVLQLDDQCVFSDHYAGDQLVLRHYVNPVRHKFWTSLMH